MAEMLSNVIPNDDYLEEVNNSDIVIEESTKEESHISTYIAQLTKQLSEKIDKQKLCEDQSKLLALILMFRGIQ
jgi:hypothetical protein